MTEESLPTSYEELLLLSKPRVIDCEDEYQRQLHWFKRILTTKWSDPNCDARIRIAELLATHISKWEDEVSFPHIPVSPRDMLKHTMEFRGLSQVELAKQLKVSTQLISAIIKGERSISRLMSRKFADFFEHPINFYFHANTASIQTSVQKKYETRPVQEN